MSDTPNDAVNGASPEDDEVEEINVDITEDNMVWIHGEDWELVLAPAEARELGEALIDAADDAETPGEDAAE
jgi:hypothetical protein